MIRRSKKDNFSYVRNQVAKKATGWKEIFLSPVRKRRS